MEKKFNFVYITTNLINGKQYVGDHSTNNLHDNYKGSGRPYFSNAKKKYGNKNFKREILEFFPTKQEAFDAQEKYIIEYNTLTPNGYNISPKGGHGTKGCFNDETKEKISIKQKGITKLSYFIKKFGELGIEKYKEYINRKRIERLGTTTKRKGKGHKQELIEKYGEKEGLEKYEQFISKQSNSHKGKYIGRKLSQETKDKIGKSNSIKLKGHKQSEETKEKRAQKQRGTKRSEETKLKMSKASKGKRKNYDVWNKNKTKLNITIEIINEIKEFYKTGKYQREIAKIYGLSISCVARILKGFYDNKEQIARGK
jgi:hypothetical protein